MKKGFTLIELLIVVVIIGILSAIALPKFTSSAEKVKASQAVSYLRVIRTGEKMYFAKNAAYIACANAAAIKANLGAEVTEENYTFVVTAPTATTFTATATRGSTTITINQDGTITGTSLPAGVTVPAN